MKLISGGQTGVDRAALDVAIALALPYGGFVPKGGLAEDHDTPPGLLATYPGLVELDTASYARRTIANVRLADATLIVTAHGVVSPGTELTRRACIDNGRPLRTILAGELTGAALPAAAEQLRRWICSVAGSGADAAINDAVINVAGPRASNWPEGYAVTAALLRAVLG